MKLFAICSCKLFKRPINAESLRHPQTASRFSNVADAFMNRIDGFKPSTLMGRNKRTNEFVVLRDWEGLKGKAGRKFVNWVRRRENNGIIQKKTLSYTGSSTSVYYDAATQQPLYKGHDNKNFWSQAIIKDGKAQIIEKYDKNAAINKEYSVYKRNTQGKLEKVFEGDYGQYQLKQTREGKDPNPFSNSAENIFYNLVK